MYVEIAQKRMVIYYQSVIPSAFLNAESVFHSYMGSFQQEFVRIGNT